jgi:hypothetical protein
MARVGGIRAALIQVRRALRHPTAHHSPPTAAARRYAVDIGTVGDEDNDAHLAATRTA